MCHQNMQATIEPSKHGTDGQNRGEEKSMGLLDSINAEDRVSIKISDLYRMMRESAYAEVVEELARKLDGSKMTGYVIKRLVREDEGEEHGQDDRCGCTDR